MQSPLPPPVSAAEASTWPAQPASMAWVSNNAGTNLYAVINGCASNANPHPIARIEAREWKSQSEQNATAAPEKRRQNRQHNCDMRPGMRISMSATPQALECRRCHVCQ